ncbi:hypothetical protein Tco_1227409 [Tanacetum coccineum]
MGRDTIQLENAVSTISQEYLLEFTSEYGIPEDLHLELPGSEDTIMDFSKGKVGMEDTTMASGSSGTPSTIEKLSLDFDNENPTPSTTEGVRVGDQAQDGLVHEVPSVETAMTTKVVQEPVLEKEVAAMGPRVNKRRHHRGTDEAEANALPKVLRKDHATPHLAYSTRGGNP